MFKKLIIAIGGGVCAAVVVYFFIAGAGTVFKSSDGGATTSEPSSISRMVPTINVSGVPVLQASTNAFQNIQMPMSPILWSQLVDGYVAAQDIQSGMFGNVRYESAAVTDDFKNTEKKTPHNFNISIGERSVTIPEMPTSISASVYYTHASGILPLTAVVNWENLTSKSFDDWTKCFTSAGFTSADEVVLQTNIAEKYVIKAATYQSPEKYTGEIIFRENIKDNDSKDAPVVRTVTHVSLFNVTDAETTVKNYLTEINKNTVNEIMSLKRVNNLLEWRRPYIVADYRFVDSSRVYGIDFATLNDRTLLNTQVPVYTTTYESWGGIPIGWSWLMFKKDWDTVKEDVVFGLTGKKNVADADLLDGVRSNDDIFVKAELVGTGTGNQQMIKVSAVDKKVDNTISTIFDHFNIVDVQGLRNQFSGELRNRSHSAN